MGSLSGASSVVVVFDFDKTLISCDSDSWVISGLGVAETFEQRRLTMPWNALMDEMMREIHCQGKSVPDIADCLRKAPVDPTVIGAIKVASAMGCNLQVVSDANLFFITTILEQHDLLRCFKEISSNPTRIDGDGRLRIEPYCDSQREPHGCPLCPPNMCKGRIIERLQAEVGPDARFIYLGDGSGDFCPALKLSAEDYILPRKEYPLSKLIRKGRGCGDGELVIKAEVLEWSTWAEQSETLLRLIRQALAPPASPDGAADAKDRSPSGSSGVS